MAVKKSKKDSAVGFNLTLPFLEDEHLFSTPEKLYAAGRDGTIVLDVETTGLHWWGDRVLGVGYYAPANKQWPEQSGFVKAWPGPYAEQVKEVVRELAQSSKVTIIGHNIKFDAHFLDLPLWERKCRLMDTTILVHLYDSRLPKNLAEAERTFLRTDSKGELVKQRSGKQVWEMDMASMATYCINDCKVTYQLAKVLWGKIADLGLKDLFWTCMQFVGLLQKVERRGFSLDTEFMERCRERFTRNILAMEQELFQKANKGKPFNWHSQDEMSRVLYDGMGIPKPINPFIDPDGVDRTLFATRGKYNATATNAFLLMEKAHHPLGELVMDLRETDIMLGTIEKWIALRAADGILHGSFNPTGTRTGRLSSSEPNLQNVASEVRNRETQSVYSGGTYRELEYNLRLALVARPGFVFLSKDWKQQEMRMFAIMAKEPEMLAAIKARLDIHTHIAKLVWPKDCEDPETLKVRREWSKTIGFGLIYGMRVGSLQLRLNMTPEQANAVAAQYWGEFPRIMPFLKEVQEACKRDGLLRYWSGRVWREDDPLKMYKGANAMVQGGSADLLMTAALRVDKYLTDKARELGRDLGGIISFIHDEVLLEVPEADLEWLDAALGPVVECEDLFGVPFITDTKVGYSYGSMDKLEKWKAGYAAKTEAMAAAAMVPAGQASGDLGPVVSHSASA